MSSKSLPLDPAAVRALFPAFADPSLEGFAFFENAGGSYISAPVLKRLETYYRENKVQPSPFYPAAQRATAMMDESYERLAQAMNVPTDWVQFGPSTSANTYVLARAFEGLLKPGDAIIVTNQDHESNTGAWRRLQAASVEVREWRVDRDTGHLDLSELDRLLDNKVRLVAMPHVSNIVGEINPVAEIAERVHAAGAWLIVDGVSYTPHGLPDVSALGADVYLFSAYKVYGPYQGVMTIRPELFNVLPNQGHFFNADVPHKKLNPAGPDHPQVAALAGIADYLETVAGLAGTAVEGATSFDRAHHAMRTQEEILLAPLLDYLRKKNGVRLLGPSDPVKRAPTVAISIEDAAGVAHRLGKRGIGVSAGHFYAYRLLEGMGVDPQRGALRMSFVHYTTPEEVDRLIAALDDEL